MNLKLIVIALLFSVSAMAQSTNFHSFTTKTIDGTNQNLADFKGKKVLAVNVASKCGLTPQYKQLQELYDKYKTKGFVIVAFPANNFLSQEPGTNKEIKEFCTSEYGVSFPVMSKISVKGEDMDPIYKWLTQKSLNGKMDSEVKWNFQKYLIDENGNLIDVVFPKESPLSEKIINWIEGK
jgi:glutathione peroxidase